VTATGALTTLAASAIALTAHANLRKTVAPSRLPDIKAWTSNMPAPQTISRALDARLGRYALAAGALAAAVPAQAAPITVILPTPVDIRDGYELDFDQDNITEFFFSGSGSTAYASYFNAAAVLGAGSSSLVLSLSAGATFGLTGNTQIWVGYATMPLASVTTPTFLAFRFQSNSNGGFNRLGFAQFYGPNLYGWAWEEARTLQTFDLSTAPPSNVPEPATGALTALALGAVALAARKRNQAQR
jgi:hypothetical protein